MGGAIISESGGGIIPLRGATSSRNLGRLPQESAFTRLDCRWTIKKTPTRSKFQSPINGLRNQPLASRLAPPSTLGDVLSFKVLAQSETELRAMLAPVVGSITGPNRAA